MSNIEEEIISTVSHELRTPLTSIRGFAQTLLSSWDKLDDESKKKFIKIIEEQSNRLTGLVENMLSVSKINKDHFVYSEVSVKSVIEQTVSLVKNQYKEHSFDVNYVSSTPNIYVDKDKFQQVLVNLVENSAKYSAPGFSSKISSRADKNFVVIEIENMGIGIEEKDYETIFKKFSRIDNHLTRCVQGSGLGLYITKNIVQKMNGEISVRSVEQEHSTYSRIIFTVKFPIVGIEEQARLKCKQ